MKRIASLVEWFGRRPVRFRLAVQAGVLTAVILIGFAAVVGRLVTNRLQDDFREELRSDAIELALTARVDTDVVTGEPHYQGADLEAYSMSRNAVIRIVDSNGNPTGDGSPNAPDLGAPSPQGEFRDPIPDLKVVDVPIRANTTLRGPLFVQYGRPTLGVDATVGRLWVFLGFGVLIGSMLAGLAGMTVANRAMAPIADLTRVGRVIARTRDPSLRLPRPEGDDEIAELAGTLDDMLGELDAARTETETTIKRQREFVADASHELRTPLTSILANLELLEESLNRSGGDEDDLAAARSALRSSRRMGRLVGDLLILARVDAGRSEEKKQDCDLAKIAMEAFEEVEAIAEEHPLSADVIDAAAIEGDPDSLHRMILNLLENSIRHTPGGTEIELRLAERDREYELIVADNGPGIPEGMEESLFGRFIRGDQPADKVGRRGDGTGLGLAIVKAVAETHRGRATASNLENGGACFRVVIPKPGPSPHEPIGEPLAKLDEV